MSTATSAGTAIKSSYSSPLVAEIGGVRQIVQFARESVFGVSIKDGKFRLLGETKVSL